MLSTHIPNNSRYYQHLFYKGDANRSSIWLKPKTNRARSSDSMPGIHLLSHASPSSQWLTMNFVEWFVMGANIWSVKVFLAMISLLRDSEVVVSCYKDWHGTSALLRLLCASATNQIWQKSWKELALFEGENQGSSVTVYKHSKGLGSSLDWLYISYHGDFQTPSSELCKLHASMPYLKGSINKCVQ